MARKNEKPKAEPKAKTKAVKEDEAIALATEKASLPQNILLIGEHAEANKEIYISQKTYKEIQQFTKNKTQIESGGILVGDVIEEFGKTNIIIHGFIEAKYSEGTPTTLKFTHETWKYVHTRIDKCFPSMKIVGWIHTHPSFGIFLSEYDKFIQGNFFNDKNQIAYVVDPIQKTEGFFYWKNEEIERCKGFFVFDEIDRIINIPQEEEESLNTQSNISSSHSSTKSWHVWVLYAFVAVLMLLYAILLGQFKMMKAQQESLKKSLTFLLSRQSYSFSQIQPGSNAEIATGSERTPEPAHSAPFFTPDTSSQMNETKPSAALQTAPSEQTDHE